MLYKTVVTSTIIPILSSYTGHCSMIKEELLEILLQQSKQVPKMNGFVDWNAYKVQLKTNIVNDDLIKKLNNTAIEIPVRQVTKIDFEKEIIYMKNMVDNSPNILTHKTIEK